MNTDNRVILVGTIIEDIKPDMVYNEELYYKTFIEVIYPNGFADKIMIVARKKKFERNGARPGRRLYVEGVVETRNEYDAENKMHVIVYVRAVTVRGIKNGKDRNEVILKGIIVKKPNYYVSTTRRRTDLILRVSDLDEDAFSYVPCAALRRLAEVISKMTTHQELKIEGRFHSRTYTKNDGEQGESTAYEILINKVI